MVRALLLSPAMKLILFSSLVLTACVVTPSDESQSTSEHASAGAGARDDRPRELTPIAIQTDLPPDLVLYREGLDGPWLPAERLKATTYEAMVSGPYTVLIFCPDVGFPLTALTSKTLDDEPLVEYFCATPLGPLQVTGTMVQPGRVNLGDVTTQSSRANWSFTLPVYPGVQDLIASSTDRVLIQRGLRFTDNVALPPIDLVQQGVAMVPIAAAVTNPYPGESITALTSVRTLAAREAILYNGPLPALTVPASALTPHDHSMISVRSIVRDDSFLLFRSAKRRVQGALAPVTLWDPLTGKQLGTNSDGDLQLSWTSVAPHDSISYLAYDNLTGATIDHLVTSSYQTATGSRRVVLSTDAPGFPDERRLDLSSFNRSLLVNKEGAIREGFIYDEYDPFLAAADKAATDAPRMRELIHARRQLQLDQ